MKDIPPPDFTLLGYPAYYTRRRYGRTTFTWVEIRIGDQLRSLGDPWPCITPKRVEMEEAARSVISREEVPSC